MVLCFGDGSCNIADPESEDGQTMGASNAGMSLPLEAESSTTEDSAFLPRRRCGGNYRPIAGAWGSELNSQNALPADRSDRRIRVESRARTSPDRTCAACRAGSWH